MFLKTIKQTLINRLTSRHFLVLLLFLTLFICLVADTSLYAQGKDAVKGSTFIDLIKAGGMVGYLIIFASIIALGLSIEHIVNVKKEKLCPPEIVAQLEALVDEGRYDEALTLCTSAPTFFTNIIGASLSKVNDGYESMLEAMQNAGEEQSAKLNQKISYLSLISNIGPMLGLTGTVTGMITAFGIIKTQAAPSPSDLAKGVEEALVTTAMGLFVAIPFSTVYFLYKNKVTLYIIELGIMAGEFVDKFKGISAAEQPQA